MIAYSELSPAELEELKAAVARSPIVRQRLGLAARLADWQMTRLVELARHALGPVHEERCYCLKRPAVLGGEYDIANFATITRQELVAFTGDVAEQIKDLPDGTPVNIEWTE